VSDHQMHVYLDEFVFRFNHRRTPMAAFQTPARHRQPATPTSKRSRIQTWRSGASRIGEARCYEPRMGFASSSDVMPRYGTSCRSVRSNQLPKRPKSSSAIILRSDVRRHRFARWMVPSFSSTRLAGADALDSPDEAAAGRQYSSCTLADHWRSTRREDVSLTVRTFG
jgi:hypothetical protein